MRLIEGLRELRNIDLSNVSLAGFLGTPGAPIALGALSIRDERIIVGASLLCFAVGASALLINERKLRKSVNR